jgi:hypothetical protein
MIKRGVGPAVVFRRVNKQNKGRSVWRDQRHVCITRNKAKDRDKRRE